MNENGKQPINAITEHNGLTKREYFAGLAMQGMFSQHGFLLKDINELTEIAVRVADELLKQLEK